MPTDKPQFKAVCPHFLHPGDEQVNELCMCMFGTPTNPKLQKVIPFLAASLIYHYDFLKQTLPATHQLWQSVLGRMQDSEVDRLRPDISIGDDGGAITLRGVPISIKILQECTSIHAVHKQQQDALEDVKREVATIAKLIPMSAAGLSLASQREQFNLFAEDLSRNLQKTIKASLEGSHPRKRKHTESESVVSNSAPYGAFNGFPLHFWGGKARAIPENFVYSTSMKIVSAWDLWWGVGSHFPPLRQVLSSQYKLDIPDQASDKKHRCRLNNSMYELREVMSYFEKNADPNDLRMLIKLTSAPEHHVADLRTLLARVWNDVWEHINKNECWHTKRNHDKTKLTVHTIFGHIKKH